MTTFPVFQGEFSIKKGSKTNTIYLGRFQRINKVEKFIEMIGTLNVIPSLLHVNSTNTCLHHESMFRFAGSDNPDVYFKDTERTRVVSPIKHNLSNLFLSYKSRVAGLMCYTIDLQANEILETAVYGSRQKGEIGELVSELIIYSSAYRNPKSKPTYFCIFHTLGSTPNYKIVEGPDGELSFK